MAYEYIDQLDQLVSSLPDDKINKLAALRGPASKPFVGPPVEVAGVQKEPESVVEAPARVSPIEYQQGYKVQLPQSELYRTNVNRALEQRQAERDALAANALDAYDKQQKQELDYGSAINRLQKATQPYERSPELSKAIQNASKQSSNLEKAPERDLLSEAILSFGPGLFAAIGGEDAALAAPAAQTQARTIYEGYRKEQGENIKERNKAIQDKYEKLLKIDSSAADDWLAKQKLNVEQARGEIDALKFGIGTTQKDIQQSQQLANQAAQDVTKGVLTGAEKTADFETLPMREKAKTARAATLAGLKPATESERKSAFQYNLSAQAQQNINDIVKKNKSYPSLKESFFKTKKSILTGDTGGTFMNEFMNKFIDDPALRSQIQAELQFLESIGRIQSGAAIKPDEWLVLREQYFPSYGDQQDSIALKEKQRLVALEGLKTMAGRAETSTPISVVAPEKTKIQKLDDLLKQGKITKEQYNKFKGSK